MKALTRIAVLVAAAALGAAVTGLAWDGAYDGNHGSLAGDAAVALSAGWAPRSSRRARVVGSVAFGGGGEERPPRSRSAAGRGDPRQAGSPGRSLRRSAATAGRRAARRRGAP